MKKLMIAFQIIGVSSSRLGVKEKDEREKERLFEIS